MHPSWGYSTSGGGAWGHGGAARGHAPGQPRHHHGAEADDAPPGLPHPMQPPTTTRGAMLRPVRRGRGAIWRACGRHSNLAWRALVSLRKRLPSSTPTPQHLTSVCACTCMNAPVRPCRQEGTRVHRPLRARTAAVRGSQACCGSHRALAVGAPRASPGLHHQLDLSGPQACSGFHHPLSQGGPRPSPLLHRTLWMGGSRACRRLHCSVPTLVHNHAATWDAGRLVLP
jgi:hypothetical protein